MPVNRKKTFRAAANLETDGERLKVYSLQTLLTNKRDPATRDAARLGDVLLPWYEKSVVKPGNKLEGLVELWQEHVPAGLVRRSRLLSFHRSTLTVAVESTTLRSELDALLRGELLKKLQAGSRGTLFRVKTLVQAWEVSDSRGLPQ